MFENGTLRITDVKPDDRGFYKCVASNIVDSISKTVLLSVTGNRVTLKIVHV